ncbi:hypothetical protein [Ralstonia flatus]|uniref:hypothetical protein n=1 Tax=Ralstonia flatus TaxID=3058601 RepID=UPI00293049E1|nr:hypothetical protein [Ralstonia sp. LMG 32965]
MPSTGSWSDDARRHYGGNPAPAASAEAPEHPEAMGTSSTAEVTEDSDTGAVPQEQKESNTSQQREVHSSEPNTPDNVKALRSADVTRKLYSPQTTYADVDFESAIASLPDLSDDVRAAAAREYREMVADLGATTSEAQQLLSHAEHAAKNPPSEEQASEWRAQATRQLVQAYGKEATQVLADAQQLVSRDPRIAKVLEVSRIGDRPETVMLFARLAQQERKKGRLR